MAAEGPAHVADAHKIRRRHTVGRADFHTQQRRVAAKPHRANAEFISSCVNVVFQLGQFGVIVFIIEIAQELCFRKLIARGSITADAHAEDARPTAFALSLLHGIEDDLAAAIEIAIGVELRVR